jgi:O-antigen/teichoic acid export membrane protein
MISAPSAASSSRDTVRAAARGMSAHMAWQLSSRLLTFAIKAAAVRAIGPAHFAFAEIRLGILTAAAQPAALGVRKVAVRSESDEAAAALVAAGSTATVLLAAVLAAIVASRDPAHAGPIALAALATAIVGMSERARVFAARRERYGEASRAQAIARISGSIATTTSAVFILPVRYVGLYATPVGLVVHAITLLFAMEHAAGDGLPPILVLPSAVVSQLCAEDLGMAAVAVWQTVFKFVLENGEGIVLDVTCVNPIKGAYKLAANIASLLARFFSEALEEQSFNVFSRLAPAFRHQFVSGVNDTGTSNFKGVPDDTDMRMHDMRRECVSFLQMALKAALLVSLLIAAVGPFFSYSFIRLLYGSKWADETPAASILSTYFIYLVFMAANGVTEAFVAATASTGKLKEQSAFSVLLSAAYMAALYYAGSTYSVTGIICVNCANMAVRTIYSIMYFTHLTGESWRSLAVAATPHVGVLSILAAGRIMCRASETAVFSMNMPASAAVGLRTVLVHIAKHAVSGAISLSLFGAAVYIFENRLRAYCLGLRYRDDCARQHID